MGKVVEGAITFYLLRKLASTLRGIKRWAEKKLPIWTQSKPESPSLSAKDKVKFRLYKRILFTFAILTAVSVSVVVVGFFAFTLLPLTTAIALSWSIAVGTVTLATLLKKSRDVRHDIGITAVIGLAYLITGTEVYEYPDNIIPSNYLPVVSELFTFLQQTLSVGLVGFKLSPIEVVVLTLNPIAYAAGIVFTFFLWKWAPRPEQTPFGPVYRD
jgi:hypothetical protein